MSTDDRALGMGMDISRRDFIYGASAVAGAAALTAGLPGVALAQEAYSPADAAVYPPLQTGLRGLHPGSFEPMHNLAWAGNSPPEGESTGEIYDLVVVGGGLSGLAAAYYFRKQAGASAKILILDNLQGIGGHAQRNEFEYGGHRLYANAGSAFLVAPPTWSYEARMILEDLDVMRPGDPRDRTDRELFRSHGMEAAVLFPKEEFGQDYLVKGNVNQPSAEFLSKTPLSAQVRAELDKLMNGRADYLSEKTDEEKIAMLQSMSYRDYLLNVVGVSEDCLVFVKGAWAMALDTCTAWHGFFRGRPGFAGLGLERPGSTDGGSGGGYTMPGGNGDLARLLVRSLIPDALPPGDVIEVADKRLDYTVLDRASNSTRIRQSSIVYNVRHVGVAPRTLEIDKRDVQISYVNDGRAYAVKAGHVVMACMNNVIPFICPEFPETQKAAMRKAVRAANLSVNVLVRNWEAFKAAGINNVTTPYGFYGSMGLASPRHFGRVMPSNAPDQPILVSFGTGGNSGILSNRKMVEAICGNATPPIGTNNDEQYQAVRRGLLAMPFSRFEREIRDTMVRSLSGTDFDPARDIVAISINRWAHGFATGLNDLFDQPLKPGEMRPNQIARQPFGKIAIANTDAGGVSTAQTAFDQAWRAVNELQPRSYGYYDHI